MKTEADGLVTGYELIQTTKLQQHEMWDYKMTSETTSKVGLTKRELFAAMAMQGWIINNTPLGPHDHYAKIAVSMADALIDQLNQKESK